MSIAFIPITAKSNLYNEEVVTNKWNSFLTNLSKNIENVSNIKINQNEFNSIIENTLLKHYSTPSSSSSTPIKNNSVKIIEQKKLSNNKDEDEDEDENEDKDKEEKKIKETKVKKEVKKVVKKEERPRCSQILKNNEQCKGKSVKSSNFCTRHTPKEEQEVEDSD